MLYSIQYFDERSDKWIGVGETPSQDRQYACKRMNEYVDQTGGIFHFRVIQTTELV